MNTEIKDLNLNEMEQVNSGTELEARLFLKHLSKKYGITKIGDFKKYWTQEERDYFERAYKRKAGDEPLGPYPD